MEKLLTKKIRELAKTVDQEFDTLRIRLECPLDSGVKIECWRVLGDKEFSQSVNIRLRDFFLFVRDVRIANPEKKFNVVEVSYNDTNTKIDYKFDEKLQQEADEYTK